MGAWVSPNIASEPDPTTKPWINFQFEGFAWRLNMGASFLPLFGVGLEGNSLEGLPILRHTCMWSFALSQAAKVVGSESVGLAARVLKDWERMLGENMPANPGRFRVSSYSPNHEQLCGRPPSLLYMGMGQN